MWEKEVELPEADKKILYKFVVDDNWVIDPQAPQEDDGHGNINNVLYPDKIKPKSTIVPETVTTSSAAPQSTTAALAGQVPLEPREEATEGRSMLSYDWWPLASSQLTVNPHSVTPGTNDSTRSPLNEETTKNRLPGAFPETPSNEASESSKNNYPETSKTEATEAADKVPETVGVNPLPATSGAGNPINLPAGEKVPPTSEVTSNSIYSSVTTSKEDYEKAGGASSLPFVGGVASLGAGIAGALGFGGTEKKENLIPESSLPIGSSAGETLDAGPTISSAGPSSTTAELAGKVPLEERKQATVIEPESDIPEVVKESIEEAHASPEAAASADAVREKAEVEQELLKKVPTADEAGEPAPTYAAVTITKAPAPTSAPATAVVAGTSSSAAAALADGADGFEAPSVTHKNTVPAERSDADTTEYAPPHTRAVAAPGVSESAAAAISDGTEDPTLADEPAVQMMTQNEGRAKDETVSTTQAPPVAVSAFEPASAAVPATVLATSETPKTETATPASAVPQKDASATPATPSSAPSTPSKNADTTPTSSPATKERKKKNRISSLFKKILH